MNRVADKFNFINIICLSVYKARLFHQQFRFTLTSKRLLGFTTARFYIRRRHDVIYLYTRILKDGFGNRQEHSKFIKDLKLCIPELELESTQGYYKGVVLNTADINALEKFLKLMALLTSPNSFRTVKRLTRIPFFNLISCSAIPVHGYITKKTFEQLQSRDLKYVFEDLQPPSKQEYNDVSINTTDDSNIFEYVPGYGTERTEELNSGS